MDFRQYMRRLRRRIVLGTALQASAMGFAAGFVVLGATFLSVKLFAPRWWPGVLWLCWIAVPLVGLAAWRGFRRAPSDREMVAWLDRRLDAGGLLMTLAEHPDPLWQQKLPGEKQWVAAIPRVRPWRFLKTVAVPAAFAIAAGLVPPREATHTAAATAAGSVAAHELAVAFDLLEKASALDVGSKTMLRTELDQLVDEAQHRPLTHEKWETVDALREQLSAGLSKTELTVSQASIAAAALAAGDEGHAALSLEQEQQLTKELSDALQELQKNGALSPNGDISQQPLPEELQHLLRTGQLKLPDESAVRAEVLDGLQKLLDVESKRLAEVRALSETSLALASPRENLSSPGLQTPHAAQPERGGASGGSDDAGLTFGEESNEQAAKFKETVLPPGTVDRAAGAAIGVTASAPYTNPQGESVRNAAQLPVNANSSTAWNHPLRPRHRDVVQGYFSDK